MKSAVIYARCASHDGEIEKQISICEKFAKTKGIDIVDVYTDIGTIRKRYKNSKLEKMIKDSHKKKWDYVIIHDFSRLGRNFNIVKSIEQRILNSGVEILSATGQEKDLFNSLIETIRRQK